jgi:hypothetical protein
MHSFLLTYSNRLALVCWVTLGTACGSVPGEVGEGALGESESAVIGGAAQNLAVRRQLGLIDSGCSNLLLRRDWILTAGHCVWLNDRFYSYPHVDGSDDVREAIDWHQLGDTDVMLVEVGLPPPGSEWPDMPLSLHTGDPALLVGQTITCYGKGANQYVPGGGVSGDGSWRSVSKTIQSFDSFGNLIINSVDGNHIVAPGDSGGPCFRNGQLVAVNLGATGECTDPQNCTATFTKITHAWLGPISPFVRDIEFLTNRTAILMGSGAI